MKLQIEKLADGRHKATLVDAAFAVSLVIDELVLPAVPQPEPEPEPQPEPEIPIGGISSGFEEAIRTAAAGKTVVFARGTYELPNIVIPKGVSVDLGGSTIKGKTAGAFNDQNAMFEIDGGLNQTIKNGTLLGGNIVSGLVMLTNCDGVHVDGIKGQDTKFTGIWARGCKNGSIKNFKLHNTSGAVESWASGDLAFSGLTNYEIAFGEVSSDSSQRGYGFKALYPGSTLANVKFHHIKTAMNHSSIWAGGKSKNIGFEIHDTKILGTVEIYDCVFGNQVSLAVGWQDQGKVIVRNNLFDTAGDTYALETLLDNLEFYDNKILNTQMIFANFQVNKKWKNWRVERNEFSSPATCPTWGGLFLIGGAGVDNLYIAGNRITQRNNAPLIKYMGIVNSAVNDSTIKANNTIIPTV
jgi:hypothetical protein